MAKETLIVDKHDLFSASHDNLERLAKWLVKTGDMREFDSNLDDATLSRRVFFNIIPFQPARMY